MSNIGKLSEITTFAVAAMLAAAVPAAAGHIETLRSSGFVSVGDFSSNAHVDGCGDRAGLSGGFLNKFDRETSRQFLFGFNPIGRDVFFGPSWRVTVANRGSAARGGGRHTTFAYCAERPPRLRMAEASVRIGRSGRAGVTARCPRGTVAVSGGFSDRFAGTNDSLVFGFRSRRAGSRGWRASAIEVSGRAASRLDALALCAPRGTGLTELTATVTVPEGGTRSTTLGCPLGSEPWSGGFESPVSRRGHGAYPYEHRRLPGRRWRAAAFAEGPAAASFTLHLYCGPSSAPPSG